MAPESSVTFVSAVNDDLESARLILEHISNEQINKGKEDNKQINVLLGRDADFAASDANALSFSSFMGLFVWLYRKFGIQRNDRVSIINQEDQLVVLQLCLAEANKQDTGEFDVEMSQVIHMNNILIQQKLGLPSSDDIPINVQNLYSEFLQESNSVDYMDVVHGVKEELSKNEELQQFLHSLNVISFYTPMESNDVEVQALEILTEKKLIIKASVEMMLDCTEITGINSCQVTLEEAMQLKLECTKSNKLSVTEDYVQEVIISYMQLLVNSRSEVALARVINIPDRELDHIAFTALKREAKTKSMPMYQTAASFIMRIRFGGKGYAPDPESPIGQHVKGLGEFVDFMHKLQTVVEEEPNSSSAVNRVINNIKNIILKSKDNHLRRSSVETVSERMKNTALSCMVFNDNAYGDSPHRSASAGGSASGGKTIRILRQLVDNLSTQLSHKNKTNILADLNTSQKTPIRIPSLLSKFRSPELILESPECPTDQTLAKRFTGKLPKNENKKTSVPRFQAGFDWALPSANLGLPDVCILPQESIQTGDSKSLMAPKPSRAKKILESLHDQENTDQDPVPIHSLQNTKQNDAGLAKTNQSKRKMDISNQPNKKQKSTKVNKKVPKPLPKGQKQLTHFFRL